MPASPVLDSFALLSFLRDEPGGEKVAALLEKAAQREQPVQMTEVNYAETQYIIRRKDGEAAWQVVAGDLPLSRHDVRMDLIVTDGGAIDCHAASKHSFCIQ